MHSSQIAGDVNATVIDPFAVGAADMHQGLKSKSQGWWLQIQTQVAGTARAFDKIEYLSMLKLGVLTARKKSFGGKCICPSIIHQDH